MSATDYNGFDISCIGYNDGGIDLTVTGSVPGYSYLWDNNEVTCLIYTSDAAEE